MHLRTHHGTLLAYAAHEGRLLQVRPPVAAGHALIEIPAAIAKLEMKHGLPVTTGPLAGCRLVRAETGPGFNITRDGKFLCAEGDALTVSGDRPAAGPWELFELAEGHATVHAAPLPAPPAPAPASRYYALNDLDRKLEKYLDFDGGTFFEAGANDGENQSNTCHFARDRGWHGVLVEPIPSRFLRCRSVRPESKVFWAALTPPGWPDPFVELTFCDLMTVTHSEQTHLARDSHVRDGERFLAQGETTHIFHAPARTVSSILEEAGLQRIDLFSLDLEGFEAPALRGVDFSRFDIRHIIVEAWNLDEITAILGDRYARIDQLSHHDHLFRRIA